MEGRAHYWEQLLITNAVHGTWGERAIFPRTHMLPQNPDFNIILNTISLLEVYGEVKK